jgi:hypothetical protein
VTPLPPRAFPRTPNGKPDFSGIWITGGPVPFDPVKGADLLDCDAELPIAREAIDIGYSLPGGLPYRPWAAALVKEHEKNEGKDDPHVRCLPLTVPRDYGLPHLQKIVQTSGLLLILDEWNAEYRQIFTDGRPLPSIRSFPGAAIPPPNENATSLDRDDQEGTHARHRIAGRNLSGKREKLPTLFGYPKAR